MFTALSMLPALACFGLGSTGIGIEAAPATPPTQLEALPASEFDLAAARHLLARAGFGGTVEQARELHALGLDGMVSWLVDYEDQPDVVGPYIWRADEKQPSIREIRKLDEKERRALRQKTRRADQRRLVELRQWWVKRMLETRRPLEEKMTLFWHGHFTTSYRDVRSSKLLSQQNDLLRTHATGNFGELLHEISRDPAMLAYLNNNQNRKGRPNENYAREVMELFTLGIGNYDEGDIKEVARAFTGWTFDRRTGRFIDNRRQHDTGVKSILGSTGRFNGADVCDLLLRRKQCGKYIAGKIFAFFAYADPDPVVVEELGELLRSCRYELKPLLKRMFKSRAFYSQRARGQQVKSPVNLLVSTIRMLEMSSPPGELLARAAARLGQELFAPPNVRGWVEGTSWITTSSLLERDNFCGALLRVGLDARLGQTDRANRDMQMEPAMDRDAPRKRLTPQERRQAQRQRRLRLQRLRQLQQQGNRALGRGAQSWTPQFSACSFAAKLGANSVDELVDALATSVLLVPLSATTRAEILAFAKGDDGSLPVHIDRLRGVDMERKLRELLHLLMSTPEFQVC